MVELSRHRYVNHPIPSGCMVVWKYPRILSARLYVRRSDGNVRYLGRAIGCENQAMQLHSTLATDWKADPNIGLRHISGRLSSLHEFSRLREDRQQYGQVANLRPSHRPSRYFLGSDAVLTQSRDGESLDCLFRNICTETAQ